MIASAPSAAAGPGDGHVGWWRRWWPVVAAGAATVVVELGAYVVGRAGGASQRNATLAMLAVAAVWVALAAPALAAGGRGWFDALCRGGIVADGSGVALAVLWLAPGPMTLWAALKVYCILAALAMAAVAVVRAGRSDAGRCAIAVAWSTVVMAALAAPFWSNGLIASLQGRPRRLAVAWLVRVNPFQSILAATRRQLACVWNEEPVMYRLTRVGEYVQGPSVRWYTAAALFAIVAGIFLGVGLLRRPAREPSPTGPPESP